MRSRAQPQQKNPKSNFRTLPMQMREVSQEDRTVELSFSSENPVDRWFGPEILCHDEGCVDLTRLQNVGSVLFHHGRDPSKVTHNGERYISQIDANTTEPGTDERWWKKVEETEENEEAE